MNLRAVLKHHRRWTWVEGTNETPPPKQIKAEGSGPADPDIDNPAYATWEEGANDAFYHILLTCEPKVQDQIADICVPAMAWKRLKDLYKLSWYALSASSAHPRPSLTPSAYTPVSL